MPVIIGAAEYPSDILEELKSKGVYVDGLDALSLALEAGSAKATNIVLMGRLAGYFEFTKEEWLTAIEEVVAPKFVEMNKKAFMLGYGQ